MKQRSILKRFSGAGLLVALTASLLMGCGKVASSEPDSSSQTSTAETSAVSISTQDGAVTDLTATDSSSNGALDTPLQTLRVGSLKGPTTIGLLNLMADSESGAETLPLSFVMETDPSALSAKVISGEVDVALVPANLAAVLYNKTNGGVVALNINTLGVLYCISADESVNHISDLSGKTVLMTGQGATPEYAMQYLLAESGITDCTLTFAAEATEIAARLKAEEGLIAVVPEPFATSALMQNEALTRRFALADEWEAVSTDTGASLVTGVTIIRKEVLKSLSAEALRQFMDLQSASIAKAVEDVQGTAALAVAQGILPNEEIAARAIPYCGLPVGDAGTGMILEAGEMEEMLSAYLQTLYDADPASVGCALPDAGFYFK